MKSHSKRTFIKTGLASALSVTGLLPFFSSAYASKANSPMKITPLIDALRSTNKPVCNKAAIKLLSLPDNLANYDLHLRSADLSTEEIQRIADAIKAVHAANGPALQSFSMSYNANLKDGGVLNLVQTLPATLTEIGLVGCGIGDAGGEALMKWATEAPKLHWLCVEQNPFSEATKHRFYKFGQARSGLLVVV